MAAGGEAPSVGRCQPGARPLPSPVLFSSKDLANCSEARTARSLRPPALHVPTLWQVLSLLREPDRTRNSIVEVGEAQADITLSMIFPIRFA